MKIIEQNPVPKNPKKKSEDGIVVTDDFIAVIDGSTSKTDKRYSYFKSNGRYAMQLIEKYIRKAPKGISCHDFCIGVAKQINKHYKESDIPRLIEHPEERLTASAVIYSRHFQEVWMVGDCQCMLNGVIYENNKPAEAVNAAKRSRFIKDALKRGMTVQDFQQHDSGRDQIIHDIITSCQQQNVSYAVIDGFPIYRHGIRVIPVPPSSATTPTTIILASDGYPMLRSTLQKSEQVLDDLIKNDPLCIDTCPATKGLMHDAHSFDDRTYVRFQV
jgi:glycerophosphoryl diester phosphodiesterase